MTSPKFKSMQKVFAQKSFTVGSDENRIGSFDVESGKEYTVLFNITHEGVNYFTIEAPGKDVVFETPIGKLMFNNVTMVPEADFTDENSGVCKCDIMVLMSSGCRCGSIKRYGS